MEQYICLSGDNEKIKKIFLKLPGKLYKKFENHQDIRLEESIINKTHVLSNDFNIKLFVVLKERNEEAVCRAIVTFYESDHSAYVGFFESFNDEKAVKVLFDNIKEYAHINNKKELVGPIDCSFWINYRFKINCFEKTYTGEPVNKEYYPELWFKSGFTVSDRYYSDMSRIPEKTDINEKCKNRLDYVLKNDYEFVNPTNETYEKELGNIYELLVKLYATFPGFKYITKEQFIILFTPMKKILKFNMIDIAYKADKICGFIVCIPNYYGLTDGHINFLKLIKILNIKRNPKQYVAMYMGVDADSAGLGGALAQRIRDKLYKYNCSAIRALVHEGKVSGHYYEKLNIHRINYVLLKKV